ncbi:hypothetical protein Avbf_18580 [Armadillidium vulgare]|nr:hypothetical protein Avbf_18580 [Armadillidium vulgare]
MEKSVDEYLNEWGFSSVSSVFKDEGIDEEAFLLLTPEYVLNVEYSEECRNVWTFFQRGNYDIIT